MKDEVERIQERLVEAVQEALNRFAWGEGLVKIPPAIFGSPEHDVPFDIKASCTKHGPTKIVALGEQGFCVSCLRECREGRAHEVLTLDDEGVLRTPELLVYPEKPVNFIEI
jgi:hypothetical protein